MTTTTMCVDFNCSVSETGRIIGDFLTTGLDMLFPSVASKYIFIIILMAGVGGFAYLQTKSWILTVFLSLMVLLFGVLAKMVSIYFGIFLLVVVGLIVALNIRRVFGGG